MNSLTKWFDKEPEQPRDTFEEKYNESVQPGYLGILDYSLFDKYICEDCGSLVAEQLWHSVWHRDIEYRLRSLEENA